MKNLTPILAAGAVLVAIAWLAKPKKDETTTANTSSGYSSYAEGGRCLCGNTQGVVVAGNCNYPIANQEGAISWKKCGAEKVRNTGAPVKISAIMV